MTALQDLKAELKKFHENEEGMETIQVVMIIAIAAIVLLLVKVMWGHISDWVQPLMKKIFGWGEEEDDMG